MVLQFRPIVPMQFEPILKALGDATPRLDVVLAWLGIDRGTLPALIHKNLIQSLVALLKAVEASRKTTK
jgi:hypothetical protein